MILLNGEPLAFETYPNGETRVNGERLVALAKGTNETNEIGFKYEDDGDLIKLMFVKRFLDERRLPATLAIGYMPYSRMDRVEGDSVFTLKYVAQFLNSLGFERTTVVEPHSDVTLALLDRAKAAYPTIGLLERVAREVGFDPARDYLFFPDAGAQKRYAKVKGYRQLVGFKERDFATGRILKLDVVGAVDGPGFKAIIVDDLCSYGGTFLLSAERLRELGAAEVYLLVGHCEKAALEGDIPRTRLLDKVFTTDTILGRADAASPLFQVYPMGGV